MKAQMTRPEFLAKKQRQLGRDGLEARYGCPHLALYEWAGYNMPLSAAVIIHSRTHQASPLWRAHLEHVKAANAGIAKLAKEYEKAISRLRRAAS